MLELALLSRTVTLIIQINHFGRTRTKNSYDKHMFRRERPHLQYVTTTGDQM